MGLKEVPGGSSRWTFIFFTVCVCSLAEGQSVVVSSSKIITAAPGDDVILPCHLEPALNVEALTVEWSKPDLKPDPSDPLKRVGYVHLFRNRIEVTDMKLASYAMRTELFNEELRRGNISLKILNVKLEDAGRYRCFIPKLNSNVKDSIVELNVDQNFLYNLMTETPLDPKTLQTQDPGKEIHAKERGRTRLSYLWILFVVSGCLLLIVISFCHFKIYHKKQEDVMSKTNTEEGLLKEVTVSEDKVEEAAADHRESFPKRPNTSLEQG